MKRKLYHIFISALAVCFALTSCKKEKDNEINIQHLEGKWNVKNEDPMLIVDGSITYTFNNDNSCNIRIYNALSNSDTILQRTYIISYDHRLITIYDGDWYTEQYNIRKLTSKEMIWNNESDRNTNINTKLLKTQ